MSAYLLLESAPERDAGLIKRRSEVGKQLSALRLVRLPRPQYTAVRLLQDWFSIPIPAKDNAGPKERVDPTIGKKPQKVLPFHE